MKVLPKTNVRRNIRKEDVEIMVKAQMMLNQSEYIESGFINLDKLIDHLQTIFRTKGDEKLLKSVAKEYLNSNLIKFK